MEGELVKAEFTEQADKLAVAQEVSEKFLDGQPYRLQDVLERMAMDLKAVQHGYIDLGRCALAIKEVHGHGEFQKIIQERFEDPGIVSYRTVARAMAVAETYTRLPINDRLSFLELGKTKQLMLAAASDEDIDEEAGTVFGLTFDDIKAMKAKEVKERIAKLEKKVEKQKEVIDKGKQQLEEARLALRYEKEKGRIIGEEEAEFDRKLQGYVDSIEGQLVYWGEQIEPKRLSERQQRRILGAAMQTVELVEAFAEKVRVALDQGVAPDFTMLTSQEGE